MIISYCLNPECSQPKNHPKLKRCNNCGYGLVLQNHYRAIKVLGKGGFGATFIGVDTKLKNNPLCVIKQLRPTANDPKALKTAISLFKREAKILDQIDHPQIPKLMDYFEERGQFYLIQQLINGQNLQREVKTSGIYGELKVRRFLEEITPILHYVHSQKIIHRDIKPGNILRRKKDGKLILIDFGAVKDQVNTQLAKSFGETALTNFSVGTMGYAPPEQLAMRPIYSSDIYALGATCVYLMTAKSPRKFDIDSETGNLLWQDQVNISSYLKKILEKMLNVNPKERYRTVQELMDVLDIKALEDNLIQNTDINSQPNINELARSLPTTGFNLNDVNNTQLSQQSMSPTQKLQEVIKTRRKGKGRKVNKNTFIKWDELNFFRACNSGKKDFSDQELQKLNLEEGKLSRYIFRYAQLQEVNFTRANLTGANFYGADLFSATFLDANLMQAYLSKCNLQNVNFKGANLTSADFTNADLSGANLSGANLKNAKINEQQLKTAKVSWNTVYPDGNKRWWKIFGF